MAKIAFSKLGLKKNEDVVIVNINDVDVEVKQYLPTAEKLGIITNVLQNSIGENNFANPIHVEVFFNLEVVYAYTNLTFTDKQKEDIPKLYDLLEQNGIFDIVAHAIPEQEYRNLFGWTQDTIEAYYKYRTSVLGILEQVSADYSNLSFDAEDIRNNIADKSNLTLLKDVVTKLG